MTLPRFYPILDTALLAARGIAVDEAAVALLEAGVGILQWRHKGHLTQEDLNLALWLAERCRSAGTQFVVNDRADIAALCGAALHIGQEDLTPADARTVIGNLPLGYSTHNESQLRAAAAEPVDYLALGPLFATASKQNPDPVVGLHELRRLRPLTMRPLVAIGGMTRDTAPLVWAAGADSVAVIGDLYPPGCSVVDIRARAETWLQL